MTPTRQRNKQAGSTPRRGNEQRTCGVFAFDEERVAQARDAMLPDSLLDDVVETFKALASATRVRIIGALATGEMCVCDMSQVLGLSVSATSHQLRALRRIKLVSHRVEGKMVYYSLRAPFVQDLLLGAARHASGAEATS